MSSDTSNKSIINSVPELLQAANTCIAVASRNRKPLNGNSDYAHKFLELRAKSFLLIKVLRPKIAKTEDAGAIVVVEEIAKLLESFFNPETKNRSEIQKDILYKYKTAIEPVITNAPDYEPTGELFPLEIIAKTRDYIIDIGKQANGCFEMGWYDASSVMIRRLLETLIIECFEKHNISDFIKGPDNNFLFLKDLIDRFLNQTKWNPSRNTKPALPKLKEIGDLSAHNRRYTAKKQDISRLQKEIRIVIEELVHIADFNNGVKA